METEQHIFEMAPFIGESTLMDSRKGKVKYHILMVMYYRVNLRMEKSMVILYCGMQMATKEKDFSEKMNWMVRYKISFVCFCIILLYHEVSLSSKTSD